MEQLEPASTLAEILAACAERPLAWGGIGPGTKIGRRPIEPGRTWLGLLDLRGLVPEEATAIADWAALRAGPLLMARNLLLARPWLPGDPPRLIATELIEACAPEGFLSPHGAAPAPEAAVDLVGEEHRLREDLREPAGDPFDGARPVLLLAPDHSPPDLVAALALAGGPPELLWARSFDTDLVLSLARLASRETRSAFRQRLSPELRPIFDEQHPRAEAELLDDLAGARDDPERLVPELGAMLSAGGDLLWRIGAFVRDGAARAELRGLARYSAAAVRAAPPPGFC